MRNTIRNQFKHWFREGWRFALASALLGAPLLGQSSLPQQPPAPPQESPPAISVRSDLVALPVTVTDRKGRYVSGLGRENFKIYEDGREQKITIFEHEDLPVTAGLVLDRSGSMIPKLDQVRAAALAFAETSNPKDEIFVVDFNETVSFALPSGLLFTNNITQLKAGLLSIEGAGETALYDAISKSLDRLKYGSGKKKALMVISDGGDNASRNSLRSVLAKAESSTALIYTIGLFDKDDPDQNPGLLRKLARISGGRAFFPGEAPQITEICREIARELREQYTLGYLPSQGAPEGKYLKFRVTATSPRYGPLDVRTRAGYRPPREDAPEAKTQGT
ncbi:MAG: VWA domain-containing protein [Candidatus Acidiferrales bacterium]